jgi:hypothetical protein
VWNVTGTAPDATSLVSNQVLFKVYNYDNISTSGQTTSYSSIVADLPAKNLLRGRGTQQAFYLGRHGNFVVQLPQGTPFSFSLYQTNGARISEFSGSGNASFAIPGHSSGVYIACFKVSKNIVFMKKMTISGGNYCFLQ